MREMIRLFVVVAVFSAVAGGLLATVWGATAERREQQELKYVKGPAVDMIMEGCANTPLDDRFKLTDGDREINFFIGEFDSKRDTVAFEVFGKGFSGDIGVMVGVNIEKDEIIGIGVTTHSESPGIGSRAQTDPAFGAQFKGMSVKDSFQVKADGGDIDALSGATITSRGVCSALEDFIEIYDRLKDEIINNMQV
jgi:electron transport complex protein RnfG